MGGFLALCFLECSAVILYDVTNSLSVALVESIFSSMCGHPVFSFFPFLIFLELAGPPLHYTLGEKWLTFVFL